MKTMYRASSAESNEHNYVIKINFTLNELGKLSLIHYSLFKQKYHSLCYSSRYYSTIVQTVV